MKNFSSFTPPQPEIQDAERTDEIQEETRAVKPARLGQSSGEPTSESTTVLDPVAAQGSRGISEERDMEAFHRGLHTPLAYVREYIGNLSSPMDLSRLERDASRSVAGYIYYKEHLDRLEALHNYLEINDNPINDTQRESIYKTLSDLHTHEDLERSLGLRRRQQESSLVTKEWLLEQPLWNALDPNHNVLTTSFDIPSQETMLVVFDAIQSARMQAATAASTSLRGVRLSDDWVDEVPDAGTIYNQQAFNSFKTERISRFEHAVNKLKILNKELDGSLPPMESSLDRDIQDAYRLSPRLTGKFLDRLSGRGRRWRGEGMPMDDKLRDTVSALPQDTKNAIYNEFLANPKDYNTENTFKELVAHQIQVSASRASRTDEGMEKQISLINHEYQALPTTQIAEYANNEDFQSQIIGIVKDIFNQVDGDGNRLARDVYISGEFAKAYLNQEDADIDESTPIQISVRVDDDKDGKAKEILDKYIDAGWQLQGEYGNNVDVITHTGDNPSSNRHLHQILFYNEDAILDDMGDMGTPNVGKNKRQDPFGTKIAFDEAIKDLDEDILLTVGTNADRSDADVDKIIQSKDSIYRYSPALYTPTLNTEAGKAEVRELIETIPKFSDDYARYADTWDEMGVEVMFGDLLINPGTNRPYKSGPNMGKREVLGVRKFKDLLPEATQELEQFGAVEEKQIPSPDRRKSRRDQLTSAQN